MIRLRRLRRYWLVPAILFAALLVYAAWPGRSTFTISPETTYVTEPVDAQGYIDYPTALNERMGKGITPENNANVLIWQALGPHPEGGTMPPEYFKWLGIEQPPEQGEYLISSDKYFQANLKTLPNDVIGLIEDEQSWKKQWDDCIDQARKWPWQAKDQPAIADWLRRNEKPLALAIEASKRPHYFNPRVSKSNDARTPRLLGSLLPCLAKCREMANALKCRAMRRIADEDFDGAWQDLMTFQRLGRLMAQGGTLVETLVGISQVAIASDGQLTLLYHCKRSSKQALDWLADLKRLPPFPTLADKFDVGERFMALDSLHSVACGGTKQLEQAPGAAPGTFEKEPLWDRLFTHNIDFDPAFRNANRTLDRLAAASRLPDRSARAQAFAQITSDVVESRAAVDELSFVSRATMGASTRGEMIGNILVTLFLPAAEKIQNAVERINQSQLNLQIAFALAAYRADNGHYPAKLEELAPKYLSSVPGDLFSGKPLIYKPTEDGYLFYSVGVNGIDDDGRWTDDEPPGDDLRVRMPVPAPKSKR
jgi:hypothetical protein